MNKNIYKTFQSLYRELKFSFDCINSSSDQQEQIEIVKTKRKDFINFCTKNNITITKISKDDCYIITYKGKNLL